MEIPNEPQPLTVEWLTTALHSNHFDVSNFVGGDMEPGVRSTVEMDLIKMYHRCLIENGVQGYTYKQFLDDYKISLLDHLARHIIVS